MLSKGPHISIEGPSLVPRILRINEKDFAEWPEAVRTATISIAKELFLAMYNPYIPASVVRASVNEQFEMFRRGLAHHYANSISEGITIFWSAWEEDDRFRDEVICELRSILPAESIDTSPHSRIANTTDATDLRLELPMLVITPSTSEEISKIIRLANKIQFAIIPRGGGSGLTGGSIPARKRSVVLSLTKMTEIQPVDTVNKTLTIEAGALTIDAYLAAKEAGLFFTVDPASKTASSIGGNIAENAGGPMCFEYGTTIDNLLSFRMVTPTGEIITVERQNHPRYKILPEETAVFEVRDASGGLRNLIKLEGTELRKKGLGKDVTNKALSGLPGVQKEGTDGIIVDATFILHTFHTYSRVAVLEFYGRSMVNSMHVINDIADLRTQSRKHGDLLKLIALEEFGAGYVFAIGYQKKSKQFEGDPISVLIVQLESNDATTVDDALVSLQNITYKYDGVDIFIAQDEAEAELFWEDRHRLSAIAKRTSGFKINEDVVLPLEAIPKYASFIEDLNIEYMSRAYRWALKKASNLHPLLEEDTAITEELAYIAQIINKEIPTDQLSDEELKLQAIITLRTLGEKYPVVKEKLVAVADRMLEARISVASHMHAGDGNWHVNIPVNSNDPMMLHNAELVAHKVMAKAQELGGEVTGEHGIGITKIAFLTDDKMRAFKEYKELVDPRNILNPAKLTQRNSPVAPFTFSFNHLIEDIKQSGLQDKERLIALLAKVQICTRCGKCKQHCPMYSPEQNVLFHPRNKNMVLGALIEAIYYTQVNTGKPDALLLAALQKMVEHCTGCGKCYAVCPVQIASPDVALSLRGYLEEEGAGGHPLKNKVLHTLAKNPATRIPQVGKLASIGQDLQNKFLAVVPKSWRNKCESPLFSGFGPRPGYRNIMEVLHLHEGSLFVPKGEVKGTILYFPGCGGAIFYRSISLAGIALLLHEGYAVLLPEQHLCCGYPLLASGRQEDFAVNQDRNITHLRELSQKAVACGYPVSKVVTACGSCRNGMERHFISHVLKRNGNGDSNGIIAMEDLALFLMKNRHGGAHLPLQHKTQLVYQPPCHAEISSVKATASGKIFAKTLAKATGSHVTLSPGCCGESGVGAMTSPEIFNNIRDKKTTQLMTVFSQVGTDATVLVNCPSCKIGLMRIFLNNGYKKNVEHVLEYIAGLTFGPKWRRKYQKLLSSTRAHNGIRFVNVADLPKIVVPADNGEE